MFFRFHKVLKSRLSLFGFFKALGIFSILCIKPFVSVEKNSGNDDDFKIRIKYLYLEIGNSIRPLLGPFSPLIKFP